MDTGLVEVTIEYYGYFKTKTRNDFEKLKVPLNLKKGIEDIKRYLHLSYGIHEGYITLINNESLTRVINKNHKTELFKNDVIKIIPVASGG